MRASCRHPHLPPAVCLECNLDTDCDDGLFCNGSETCVGGVCQPGADPCGGAAGDEVTDRCQVCGLKGDPCVVDGDCCADRCRGRTGRKTCE